MDGEITCATCPHPCVSMFDSQFCSLVTVTFLVHLFGFVTVVAYRLRGHGRFNQVGLVIGLLTMGIATLICMPLDATAGIAQGLALVFVATCSTWGHIAEEHLC